jgi:hypothetical protein
MVAYFILFLWVSVQPKGPLPTKANGLYRVYMVYRVRLVRLVSSCPKVDA